MDASVKHFDPDVASAALACWDAEPDTLTHLGTSGNTVYRFEREGKPFILRLTDTGYRSPEHNHAEMAFLDHLGTAGVTVALPVRSRSGMWVERLDGLSASVLTWAPGERVEPGGRHWTESMLREWGRHLARIHEASRTYRGPSRWDWRDEVFFTSADELIPASDREARAELERAYAVLERLARGPDVYGMTHADFGAQNFHYDPAGGISSFDFGNCCTHWFASDLVISLSTLRRLPERVRFRDAILDGYREVGALDDRAWGARDTFMRLRIVYVYLSRLMKFGASPTPDEQETLQYLRGLVGRSLEWP